jgi:hypothetical protein
MTNTGGNRPSMFGTLSLLALGGAVLTATSADVLAGLGAIAGIGYGFIVCILAPIFAIISLVRQERPWWPAAVGLLLGLIPGLIGIALVGHMCRGR